MNGAMGIANAQRMLEYIRTLAQFISQPEYAPVIQMFGFINEPNANALGKSAVGSFYLEAYKIIRDITGIGQGKGPMLSIHDGFIGIQNWYDFLPGADRLALDQHTYMVFVDQPQGTLSSIVRQACGWWARTTNNTSIQYGVNVAGEWSAATNDCGKWINSVGSGSRYDGSLAGYTGPTPGSCSYWNDWTQWNQSTIDDIQHFVLASMDSLQNYFFWTWKIGNSTGPIAQVNPFWHYRLGLQHGWVPKDPRMAVGVCAGDGVSGDDFSGTYASAYMTGGPVPAPSPARRATRGLRHRSLACPPRPCLCCRSTPRPAHPSPCPPRRTRLPAAPPRRPSTPDQAGSLPPQRSSTRPTRPSRAAPTRQSTTPSPPPSPEAPAEPASTRSYPARPPLLPPKSPFGSAHSHLYYNHPLTNNAW